MDAHVSAGWVSAQGAQRVCPCSILVFSSDGASKPKAQLSSSARRAPGQQPRLAAAGAVPFKDEGPLLAELRALELAVAAACHSTSGNLEPLIPHKMEVQLEDEMAAIAGEERLVGRDVIVSADGRHAPVQSRCQIKIIHPVLDTARTPFIYKMQAAYFRMGIIPICCIVVGFVVPYFVALSCFVTCYESVAHACQIPRDLHDACHGP